MLVQFSDLIRLDVRGVTFLMFCLFAIAALGYALGRITIKGINLGTAGVFIVALLFGCFFYTALSSQLTVTVNGESASFVSSALKVVENMGLMLFVTSVGFIAGPNFVNNFKKNFKSYVSLGLIIIVFGAIACIVCILIGRNFSDLENNELTAILTGLLAGSLTSTPAFSAAKEVAGPELEPLVSVGYGIAYLFGVIGVVLFVQLIPKLTRANMDEERAKLTHSAEVKKVKYGKELIDMDGFGIMPFALAVVCGIVIGSFKIQSFSLTNTGGCLLMGLILGHFAHAGRINLMPSDRTLKVFRELGLMLFLMGAGISGGANFIKYFDAIYFVYGIVMTLVPMVVGFLFAKYVLKLSLLNNLGSITGGMTSTPALGTLIHVAGTEDVASAYAATYPIALVSVVLASELIIIFL